MRVEPRVAFFTDSFLEVNGVAHTSRQLAEYTKRCAIPFLIVHAAPETGKSKDGSLTCLGLARTRCGFMLDSDLRFDFLMWRYAKLAIETVREFRAEAVHITGPSDIGQLGLYIAHKLKLPVVISWHTNLHEYAARRLSKVTSFLPGKLRDALAKFAEQQSLRAIQQFYRLGAVLLAPNEELCGMLERSCHRPVSLVQRGVDTELFSPLKRERCERIFTLGYVGRLSPEKNVRILAGVEKQLLSSGFRDFRFVIVGTGSEQAHLEQTLQCAEFTGVLKGEALARVYANFDLFIFPSTTDTFGNVVLEAMASGVPAIVSPYGGPKFIIKENVSGLIAKDECEIAQAAMALKSQPGRLEQMRRAARHMACRESWESVFEQVFQAYALSLRRTEGGARVRTRPAVAATHATN